MKFNNVSAYLKFGVTIVSSLLVFAACSSSSNSSTPNSGAGSGTPGSSVRVTNQKLISQHWCQMGFRKESEDSSPVQLPTTHFITQLSIDGSGLLFWQAHSVDSFFQEDDNKKVTCHETSASTLDCAGEELTHLQYAIDSTNQLFIGINTNGTLGDFLLGVRSFHPCSEHELAQFPKLFPEQ